MTITITAEGVAAICGVMVAISTASVFVLNLLIDNKLAKHGGRLKEWINGSFMRAATVQAELRTIRAQVGIPELE